jgi:hypothetical protein
MNALTVAIGTLGALAGSLVSMLPPLQIAVAYVTFHLRRPW